jgi:hypothetical protein
MQEGRVCVAGYDQDGKCVRPVLPPPGIHESSLYFQGHPIVFPFAVVEYDFQKQIPEPPHTEDWRYEPTSIQFIKRLDEKQKRKTLDESLSSDVSGIFRAPIITDVGYYVMAGQGACSLGTIRIKQMIKAVYEHTPDRGWRYRLQFTDRGGDFYSLPVSDLAWRYYNDTQREAGLAPVEISSTLTAKLRASEIYLRVGLARGWEEHPDRCYLQITGVYTFPDYLEGRTFADFKPKIS